MSPETTPLQQTVDSDTLAGGARLWIHIKDNQVQYLLGLLLLHTVGAFDKIVEHGSGICGI
jgi:hypothetical protein